MIIDGKKISKEYLKKIKEEVSKLNSQPKVVDIVIGENRSSKLYIKNKRIACTKVGIIFEELNLASDISQQVIINLIKQLNKDEKVSAIMIQLPLPRHFDTRKIINTINSQKDVDGLTDDNQIKLYNNIPDLIPCTPKGILNLLKYYKIKLKGKHVVIIGRSNLVGKPLLNLLLNEDATVTICHSKTKELSTFTKNADILISATNQCNLIKKKMVKKESVIIDVGMSYNKNILQGNVSQDVIKKVAYITPVPGGVGPMTVAMFLENVLLCHKKGESLCK